MKNLSNLLRVSSHQNESQKVRISLMDYTERGYFEKENIWFEECIEFKNKDSITWIQVIGCKDTEFLHKLGKYFEIHSLVLDDIMKTNQRPKTEEFEKYVYIVVKMLCYDTEIDTEQVSILVGDGFVISIIEDEGDLFDPIRDSIRTNRSSIRKMKSDYLAYSLIDSIIDHYFHIMEGLGEQIEDLQDRILDNPSPDKLREVHKIRNDILYLRKTVWPTREMLGGFQRCKIIVGEAMSVFLRDLNDHVLRIIDNIEIYRDINSTILDIYLSTVNNRMNEVMKVLTVITTIFMPLSFIAGIYGMNFPHIPEFHLKGGYFYTLGIMALIAGGMVLFFKNKKWI